MTETKINLEAWINYCFADNPLEKPIHLDNFLRLYTKDEAGSLWACLCIEDDNLVIELKTGFHCLHIPLKLIDELRTSLREA